MPTREFRQVKPSNEKKNHQNLGKGHNKKPFLMIFSIFILVLIAVTFLGAPLISRLGQSRHISFGTYNGQEITFYPGNYMSNQSNFVAEQIRQSNKNQNIQWQAYQVWRTAFERTVVHMGILQEAEKTGVYITNDRIDTALTKSGPYVQNGEFSEDLYKNTSVAERSKNREFFKEDIIHKQYLSDTLQNVKESSKEIDFIKSMASDERNFKYISFSFNDFPQTEVLSYAKENKSLFRDIKVSRITIKSGKSDAESIHKQLTANPALFEELAKAQSKDSYAEKGGEMGWQSYYSLEPDFKKTEDLDALFQLKKGSISKVMETTFGWVIFKCDEEVRNFDESNEDDLQAVRSYIQQFEGGRVEDYLIQLGKDFKNASLETGFENEASAAGRTVYLTDSFPINYGNSFFLKQIKAVQQDQNGLMNQAATNNDFFKTAFSLKKDEISAPVVLGTTIIVLQLTGEKKAADNDLQMVDIYFPYILQQYGEQEVNNFFLKSGKLKDTFDTTFYKYFLPKS